MSWFGYLISSSSPLLRLLSLGLGSILSSAQGAAVPSFIHLLTRLASEALNGETLDSAAVDAAWALVVLSCLTFLASYIWIDISQEIAGSYRRRMAAYFLQSGFRRGEKVEDGRRTQPDSASTAHEEVERGVAALRCLTELFVPRCVASVSGVVSSLALGLRFDAMFTIFVFFLSLCVVFSSFFAVLAMSACSSQHRHSDRVLEIIFRQSELILTTNHLRSEVSHLQKDLREEGKAHPQASAFKKMVLKSEVLKSYFPLTLSTQLVAMTLGFVGIAWLADQPIDSAACAGIIWSLFVSVNASFQSCMGFYRTLRKFRKSQFSPRPEFFESPPKIKKVVYVPKEEDMEVQLKKMEEVSNARGRRRTIGMVNVAAKLSEMKEEATPVEGGSLPPDNHSKHRLSGIFSKLKMERNESSRSTSLQKSKTFSYQRRESPLVGAVGGGGEEMRAKSWDRASDMEKEKEKLGGGGPLALKRGRTATESWNFLSEARELRGKNELTSLEEGGGEEEADEGGDGVIEGDKEVEKIVIPPSQVKTISVGSTLIKEGDTLVVVGEPNSGKSRLLSALVDPSIEAFFASSSNFSLKIKYKNVEKEQSTESKGEGGGVSNIFDHLELGGFSEYCSNEELPLSTPESGLLGILRDEMEEERQGKGKGKGTQHAHSQAALHSFSEFESANVVDSVLKDARKKDIQVEGGKRASVEKGPERKESSSPRPEFLEHIKTKIKSSSTDDSTPPPPLLSITLEKEGDAAGGPQSTATGLPPKHLLNHASFQKTQEFHNLASFCEHEVSEEKPLIVINDEVPLHFVAKEEWQDSVAWVPQVPALVAGSIKDNILVGASSRVLEVYKHRRLDLWEKLDLDLLFATKSASLYDVIMALPEKAESMVYGEPRLSNSQLQRLALARGLIRKPMLMVMDECTSALDESSELQLLRRVKSSLGRHSILVIAVHPCRAVSVGKCADSMIFLENDAIVDSGTPAEVLARQGLDDGYDGPDLFEEEKSVLGFRGVPIRRGLSAISGVSRVSRLSHFSRLSLGSTANRVREAGTEIVTRSSKLMPGYQTPRDVRMTQRSRVSANPPASIALQMGGSKLPLQRVKQRLMQLLSKKIKGPQLILLKAFSFLTGFFVASALVCALYIWTHYDLDLASNSTFVVLSFTFAFITLILCCAIQVISFNLAKTLSGVLFARLTSLLAEQDLLYFTAENERLFRMAIKMSEPFRLPSQVILSPMVVNQLIGGILAGALIFGFALVALVNFLSIVISSVWLNLTVLLLALLLRSYSPLSKISKAEKFEKMASEVLADGVRHKVVLSVFNASELVLHRYSTLLDQNEQAWKMLKVPVALLMFQGTLQMGGSLVLALFLAESLFSEISRSAVVGILAFGFLLMIAGILAGAAPPTSRYSDDLNLLWEVLHLPKKANHSLIRPIALKNRGHSTVALEKVSYSYPNSIGRVVKEVSVYIREGSQVVLLGPSLCGKSTVLRLISGLLLPQSGSVSIGPYKTSELEMDSFREDVLGFLNSPSFVDFEKSVYENVTFGKKVKLKALIKTCQMVGLLPKNMDELDYSDPFFSSSEEEEEVDPESLERELRQSCARKMREDSRKKTKTTGKKSEKDLKNAFYGDSSSNSSSEGRGGLSVFSQESEYSDDNAEYRGRTSGKSKKQVSGFLTPLGNSRSGVFKSEVFDVDFKVPERAAGDSRQGRFVSRGGKEEEPLSPLFAPRGGKSKTPTQDQKPVSTSFFAVSNIFGGPDEERITKKTKTNVLQEFFSSKEELKFFLEPPKNDPKTIDRIHLARALVKNPIFLVLDDPLSSLSLFESEKILSNILRVRKADGLSSLLATHRVRARFLVEDTDRIVVLHEGRVIEQGEPNSLLMKEKGAFVELMRAAPDRERARV